MQVKTIKKLFWSKYPFKIECRILGASHIVRQGIQRCLVICNNDKMAFGTSYRWGHASVDKVELALFIKAVKPFLDKEVKVRAEGSHYNIFCKDLDLYKEMKKKLYKWITFVYEPENEEVLSFMLSNGPRKVVVKQLPKEKYKYKITMKYNMPLDARKNFIKWTEKYDPGIFDVSRSSKAWMEGAKMYAQDPFFYIQDNSVLTLTSLYLGNNIKKIEEFVLADTIKEA